MFTLNISSFLVFVHRTVISGSLVLYLFDPSQGWLPNDMDLYMPRSQASWAGLHSHNPVKDVTERHCHYHACNDIVSMVMLTNGDHTIDIVELTTISALSPIFKFHLTAVMNYVTAEGFFSAYPVLTTHGRSLINPMQFISNLPTSSMAACFDKYLLQGYDLRYSPQ
ncbi:hypothetical protein PAXINDRAFT_80753, partial [Paxillus involutus ATCC 200175]